MLELDGRADAVTAPAITVEPTTEMMSALSRVRAAASAICRWSRARI